MRRYNAILLGFLLTLSTLALADTGQPIGHYLTPANTSTDLPDVNTRLPKQWVVFSSFNVVGNAYNNRTVDKTYGGSSGAGTITVQINNTNSSPLYVAVQQTGDFAPTPSPGFSMSGGYAFGGVPASSSGVNYPMEANPAPGTAFDDATFNNSSTDLYFYVSTASSGTYGLSNFFSACTTPTPSSLVTYSSTGLYLDVPVTSSTSQVTLSLGSGTCSVSVN